MSSLSNNISYKWWWNSLEWASNRMCFFPIIISMELTERWCHEQSITLQISFFRERKNYLWITSFFSTRRRKIMTSSSTFISSLCLVAIVLHHSLHDSKRAKKKVPLLWIRKWKRNKSALEFSYGGTLMKSICCVQKTHIHRARAVELMTSFFSLSFSIFAYLFFLRVHTAEDLFCSHIISMSVYVFVCKEIFLKFSSSLNTPRGGGSLESQIYYQNSFVLRAWVSRKVDVNVTLIRTNRLIFFLFVYRANLHLLLLLYKM